VSARACGCAGAGLLAIAAIAAVAMPLATYAITLACFGIAHAVVELRVLDLRYRERLRGALPVVIAIGLAAIFAARIAANVGVLPRATQHGAELLIAAAMVLALVPALARRGGAPAGLGLAVVLALLLGLAISPMHALLVAAVLHNLAPWPLVLDAIEPRTRRRANAIAIVVFVLVPTLIATGLPFAWLQALGVTAPEAMPIDIGPLDGHMRAFLPPSWLARPELALHAFSACAYLQCAHYVGVLLVLPRTVGDGVPARWRLPGRTVALCIGVAALAVTAYAIDFASARAWYGTLAGVHAWAEFPALALVLIGPATSTTARIRTTPRSSPSR
jgi:hypothetical protein